MVNNYIFLYERTYSRIHPIMFFRNALKIWFSFTGFYVNNTKKVKFCYRKHFNKNLKYQKSNEKVFPNNSQKKKKDLKRKKKESLEIETLQFEVCIFVSYNFVFDIVKRSGGCS